MNKNWSNNLWIDCKLHSNLVELIVKDLDFEEEFKKLKILLSRMNF